MVLAKASCEAKDGCLTDCINGDPDCSCAIQQGYKCQENETCKGNLLKNWDGFACCSVACSPGNLVSQTQVKELSTETTQKETKVVLPYIEQQPQKQNNSWLPFIVFGFGLLVLIIEFWQYKKHH